MDPVFPDSPPEPPAPPGATRRETPAKSLETDGRAVFAFALGLMGVTGTLFGLGLLLGLPAVVIGAVVRRDLHSAPESTRRGRRLATAAVALGAAASTLFFAWIGAILVVVWRPPAMGIPRPPPISVETPTISPLDSAALPWEPGAPESLVVLHRTGGPLREQLARQAAEAHGSGALVLVETTAPGCGACEEIAQALLDPRAQSALAHVRLVDVDVGEFHSELGRLRMDESTAPWFYLLDGRGEPRDAISADEWDENDAAEIAPVLRAFVHGGLRARRHGGWHGGATL